MATKTEICNMAISFLGTAKPVSDIDTDRSNEASACNRFYDDVRDQVLRDFDWPFATKFADMGTATDDPTTEWSYSYAYPSDCVRMRRLSNGVRNTTPDTDEPYRIVYEAAGAKIYTDLEDATGEYTVRVTDDGRFASDFVMAFALRLAINIAPRITTGDTSSLVISLYDRYNLEISRAAANAMNEQVGEYPPDAEMIRARE